MGCDRSVSCPPACSMYIYGWSNEGGVDGDGNEGRSMCEVSVVERKLERVCEFKGLGICIR